MKELSHTMEDTTVFVGSLNLTAVVSHWNITLGHLFWKDETIVGTNAYKHINTLDDLIHQIWLDNYRYNYFGMTNTRPVAVQYSSPTAKKLSESQSIWDPSSTSSLQDWMLQSNGIYDYGSVHIGIQPKSRLLANTARSLMDEILTKHQTSPATLDLTSLKQTHSCRSEFDVLNILTLHETKAPTLRRVLMLPTWEDPAYDGYRLCHEHYADTIGFGSSWIPSRSLILMRFMPIGFEKYSQDHIRLYADNQWAGSDSVGLEKTERSEFMGSKFSLLQVALQDLCFSKDYNRITFFDRIWDYLTCDGFQPATKRFKSDKHMFIKNKLDEWAKFDQFHRGFPDSVSLTYNNGRVLENKFDPETEWTEFSKYKIVCPVEIVTLGITLLLKLNLYEGVPYTGTNSDEVCNVLHRSNIQNVFGLTTVSFGGLCVDRSSTLWHELESVLDYSFLARANGGRFSFQPTTDPAKVNIAILTIHDPTKTITWTFDSFLT